MMGGGLLVWALLAGLVVIAIGGMDRVRELFQPGSSRDDGQAPDELSRNPSPEDILRERYAKGELSRDEYLEARETLAN